MHSQEIVDEIDEDESGLLEFPEFVQLAAKFLIEEDEEQMKWELKEAFRIYDKHGEYLFLFISRQKSRFSVKSMLARVSKRQKFS